MSIIFKTIEIFGWAFKKNQTSGDIDEDDLHEWTGIIIENGKFIELYATWDLLKGITAGHIFIAFNELIFNYYDSISGISFSTKMQGIIKHKSRMINSLDDDEDEYYDNSKSLKTLNFIYILLL